MHAQLLTRPAPLPRPPLGTLYFEDFGGGPAPPLPPPAPELPPLTAADVQQAWDGGFADGRRAALTDAETNRAEAAASALSAITSALHDAAAETRAAAEAQGAAIARLLLAALGAVLPDLCGRFGAAEAAAAALAIQHALHHEPAVEVRVNPHTRAGLESALDVLEPDVRARLRFIETDAVAQGDARIEWQGGATVRDGAALWRSVVEILTPLGMLGAGTVPG